MDTETDSGNTEYCLDKQRRIIRVGGWDSFALENQGEKAVSRNVVGQAAMGFYSRREYPFMAQFFLMEFVNP
jgi:hypothetical protein